MPSVLRYFSPSGSGSRSPSRSRDRSQQQPILRLHVPAYGVLYINRPTALHPLPESAQSRRPTELRGELEVKIPKGLGARRAKGLRVGIRTTCILDMGEGRKHEEDVIFQRTSQIQGGSDGLWLGEGSHTFEFSLILPADLAPHDWHPGAMIRHDLFAELEGELGEVDHSGPPSSNWLGLRSRSASPSGSSTPRGSFVNHFPLPDLSEMSFVRQQTALAPAPAPAAAAADEDGMPQTPTYEESEAEARAHGFDAPRLWLKGQWYTRRTIKLCFNPHPSGAFSDLDVRISDFTDGLGPYNLLMTSVVWRIGALLRLSFDVPHPSPLTTIFHVRVSLQQSLAITSPRVSGSGSSSADPETRLFSFPIVELGKAVSSSPHNPGTTTPALWRGTQAGGDDSGVYAVQSTGRLPNDRIARPTTVDGLSTPIRVTHALVLDVFFSVFGEDAKGQQLRKAGPGSLRQLQVKKPIILPACPIIPQILELPPYPTHPGDGLVHPSQPCAMCKVPVEDKLCTSCPPTRGVHPRHDHPPKLVGNPDGICPVCSTSVMPIDDQVGWKNCTCGLSNAQLESLEEGEAWRNVTSRGTQEARDELAQDKYEYERGRRR